MPTIITFGQLASQAFGAMRRRLDRYFSNVVLLLTGRPVSGYSYIKDASTNNFALTVTGGVTSNRSNPFLGGYYSNYLNGTSYITLPSGSTSSINNNNNFTLEFFTYITGYQSTYNSFFGGSSADLTFAYSSNSSWGIYVAPIGSGPIIQTGMSYLTFNQWLHIALVRNGSAWAIYVNGVKAATATAAQSFTNSTKSIGSEAGSNSMLGYISNFRYTNSIVYTNNFIPPTSPLTAIANTVLLTCQSNRFVDNSTYNYALTLVGTPTVSTNTPFAVSNASGYYSYSYSSSTGYLLTPATQTQFGFGTADYSIEMWVNMASTSAYGRVFTASGNNSNMDFAVGGVFTYYDGASYTGGTFVAGTWTHVAITRNSSVLRVFQDGKLVYNGSNSTNIGTTNQYAFAAATNGANPTNQYQSNIRIVKGGIPSAYVTSNTTNGTQVFIPSRVPFTGSESLTAGSVALLTGQANGVIDTSVNGINFTVAGSVTTVPNNPFSKQTNAAGYWSGSFNGSAYITTPYNSAFQVSGDMTIEFWVNFSATFTNAGLFMFDGFSGYGVTIDTSRWVVSWLGVNIIIGTTGASIPSPSVWTHVALVRNSGTVRLYINGVQLSSAAGAAVTVVTGTFDIGRGNDGTAFNTTGYISNFRYVSGTCLYPSGTTFTPPTAPLTAISGTAYLVLQNAAFIDNSTNAFTITNSSATNSTIQPFGTPILTPAVPTVDYSPQSQTTLVTNNAGYYSGYFDGSTGYLTVPANSAFTLGTNNHTIEFWMYLAGAQGTYATQWYYSSGVTQQATNNYYFQAANSGGGSFSVLLGSGGAWGVNINAGSALYNQALNNWTHVAITRSGSTFRLFANGIQVGSATYSGSISAQGGGMLIGTDGSNYATGYISNFRIVNGTAVYTANFTPPTSPLTAITNTALLTCQNSTYIDNSTNSFAITPTGKTQPSTYMPFPNTTGYWSGSFNGTSQYLNTTSSSSNYALGSGAYTVETWVYITGTSATYGFGVFGTYYTTLGWSLTLNRSTGGPIGVYWISGGAGQITTSAYVSSNVWVHIAVVRTSTATNGTVVYVNGTAVATGTDATNDTYVNNLYIGNQGPGSTYFPGYISNARLVNGTAVYTSNFTPPTTPLTAITNTQFLSCQNNTFIDNSTNAAAITNNGSAVAFTNQPFTPTPLSLGYATSTAVTPASYGAGLFGGSTNALTVANQPISTTANTFTVEAWIYPTATPTGTIPAVVGDNGSTYSNWSFGPTSSNTLQFYWYTTTGVTATGNTTILLNTWTHIAVSVNSGAISLYVNGIAQTITGTSTLSNRGTAGSTLAIGSFFSGSYAFTGYISNLRVVAGTALYTSNFIPPTAPLSPVTNASLLTLQNKQSINNNVFYDDSSNNFALTKTGTVAQGSFTPFAPAYSNYFDGSAGLLTTATAGNLAFAFGTSDFSLDCWFYSPVASTMSTASIMSANVGSVSAFSVYLEVSAGAGRFLDYNPITTTTNFLFSGGTVNNNSWTHLAITRQGLTIRGFVNGVLVGNTTLGSITNYSTTSYAQIGTAAGGTCYLSNARIIKGGVPTLFSTSSTTNSTQIFTPPKSPYIGNESLTGGNISLLTCQSNNFIDNSINAFPLTITNTVQVQAFNPFNPEYAYNPATNSGSLYFPATSNYLYYANNVFNISSGTLQWTFETWVYPTNINNIFLQLVVARHMVIVWFVGGVVIILVLVNLMVALSLLV